MISKYAVIFISVAGLMSCRANTAKFISKESAVASTQSESAGGSSTIARMKFIKFPDRGFAMQETEVTRGQWKELMGQYPEKMGKLYPWDNCAVKAPQDDHPVTCVRFSQAVSFAEKMTKRNDGYKYRLPTEQEWESVAGDIQGSEFGWIGVDQVQSVRKRKPNNELYDMLGNVFEYTSSKYDNHSDDITIRGAFFGCKADCSTSQRSWFNLDTRSNLVGFRLLRDDSAQGSVAIPAPSFTSIPVEADARCSRDLNRWGKPSNCTCPVGYAYNPQFMRCDRAEL